MLRTSLLQALFALACVGALAGLQSARAAQNAPLEALPRVSKEPKSESLHSGCFDFSKKTVVPLREPLAWPSNAAEDRLQDISDRAKVSGLEAGKPPHGYVWARARGIVHKPIQKVLSLLLDHNTTKSGKVKQLEVKTVPDPHYLARHVVEFRVSAVLFFTVSWTEDWAYALAEGTAKDPQRIVISYQKVEGTGHIEHLCGNIVLSKATANSTDVYAYEEVKATQRTDEDTENGLRGTLVTLRNKHDDLN